MMIVRALLTVILTVNFSLTAIANCCAQTAHVGAMVASAVEHHATIHNHSDDTHHEDRDCGKSGSYSGDSRLQMPLAEAVTAGPASTPVVVKWLVHSAPFLAMTEQVAVCHERPPDQVMSAQYLFVATDRLLV
jgi:hypothetical protein